MIGDYQKEKEALKNHPVSESVLHVLALRWYASTGLLKMVIWSSAIILPIIIATSFSAPLVGFFLTVPVASLLSFLSYENKLIKHALSSLSIAKKVRAKLEIRAEKEEALVHSLNDVYVSENNNNFSNVESWGIEKGGELLREVVLETKAAPKTEKIVHVSEKISEKAKDVLLAAKKSNEDSDDFFSFLDEINGKYADNLVDDKKQNLPVQSKDVADSHRLELESKESNSVADLLSKVSLFLSKNKSVESSSDRTARLKQDKADEVEAQKKLASLGII